MKLSIITLESVFPEEAEILTTFFKKGVEHIYIRKPLDFESNIKDLINGIPTMYHKQIFLQDHLNLMSVFDLGGVVLTKKNPQSPLIDKKFSKVVICRKIEDILKYINFHQILFGPIFDEANTTGLKPNFTVEELKAAKQKGIIDSRIVAMGGINENTIPLAKAIGFKHIAAWSNLWKGYTETKDIDELYKTLNTYLKLCVTERALV